MIPDLVMLVSAHLAGDPAHKCMDLLSQAFQSIRGVLHLDVMASLNFKVYMTTSFAI